jgi:acyl carrier protein
MNSDQIRSAVFETLKTIAPEFKESDLQPERSLRDQIDLDSMDWMNILVGLQARFHIDIPETDYGRLVTLNAVIAYLASRGV